MILSLIDMNKWKVFKTWADVANEFSDIFNKHISKIFEFPKEKGFIEKRNKGIVIYQKPRRNVYTGQHKQVNLNRRLETQRVRTHTKK